MKCCSGRISLKLQRLAFRHRGQLVLQIFVFFVFLVFAFFVDFQKAFELHHAAGCAEHVITSCFCRWR